MSSEPSSLQAPEVIKLLASNGCWNLLTLLARSDYTVAEVFPVFVGAKRQLHWSFPDPSKATGSEEEQVAVYRQVRDAIRERIEAELLQSTAG